MQAKEILEGVLKIAYSHGYPDIHLCSGSLPIVRDNTGYISEIDTLEINQKNKKIDILDIDIIKEIEKIILGNEKFEEFQNSYEIDSSYSFDAFETRYRVNCYKDIGGDSIAMRVIPKEIPTLESLGLGENIKKLCSRSKGLMLITGPTGSGKSTNLAGMIDFINTNFKKHIITIEDPVEFVFKNKQSLINQREVGMHTKSFASAMKGCLREDPDVIMVGEMRDPETIKAAITLAETGHLVFSTLHTNDTVQSIDRIVDVFPGTQQDQIRMQLAMSLVGVIAQRLLAREDKDQRIAAREILINNDAVRNLIISGKTHQLYSVIEVSQKQGMILMDNYLVALYKKGIISESNLMSYARDKENIESLLQ